MPRVANSYIFGAGWAMESDSDGSETVWDGRTWGGLERANWSIKGIQGPWKEEKREEEREGRRETGRAPPTS